MKLKHVLTIHVLLITLLIAVSGCGATHKKGECVKNALIQGARYTEKGYAIRYGHYYAKSKYDVGHMWCEWWDGKEWRIAKDTTPKKYVADWYGYPN